jgi:hypothetical protein
MNSLGIEPTRSVKSPCPSLPKRGLFLLLVKEGQEGFSESVFIIDELVISTQSRHPGERRGPEQPVKTGFRLPPE